MEHRVTSVTVAQYITCAPLPVYSSILEDVEGERGVDADSTLQLQYSRRVYRLRVESGEEGRRLAKTPSEGSGPTRAKGIFRK